MPKNLVRWLWFALGLVLLARLITLGLYPLMGTTEPRYAEIARKMLEKADWVTPWYDHGVPFWGKPPMSFWGSALTMALFGVNEFAVRLGPFLATLGCLALLWAWPGSAGLALAAALVSLSSLAGFVSAGAVMTDMFMTLGTTACMVAFWRALQEGAHSARWGWVFFVGIAAGLMAKGPVATVLTGIALGLWLCVAGVMEGSATAVLRRVWQRLPWVRGSLLAAALTVPWYLLAELRTPGFLNYFIVGEHIQRFLVSGWTGDLYGQGHAEPRGTIWWFALVGWMPWPVLVPVFGLVVWRKRKTRAEAAEPVDMTDRQELTYLAAWVLAPLLFFTVARNILPSYVLPGLPAFGLLVAMLGLRACRTWAPAGLAWAVALLVPVLVCVGLQMYPGFMDERSQRTLLKSWTPGEPLVYIEGRPLSADFYSRGQAVLADKPADMQRWLAGPGMKDGKPVTLVMERFVYARQPTDRLAGWRVVAEHGGFVMLRKP